MIKLFISSLLILLFGQHVLGQAGKTSFGIIEGKVADMRTKEPITGALVLVEELGLGAVSDSAGNFKILSVPVGVYTLKVKYLGYLEHISKDISVLAGKTKFCYVWLEEDAETLAEVDVRSFRYENVRTKPISTFSFSREEISNNPGAQGDIFRAIGMLPGVTSSGGIYSAIAVRGQGVRDNVYMVDDVPLTEVGHLEGNSFFNDPNGGRFSIFAPRVIDQAIFQGGAFGSEYGRRSASVLGLSIKEGNKQNPILDGQIDLLGFTVNYDGPSGFNKNTGLFISARYQNFLPVVKIIGLENLGLPSYSDFILKSTTQINPKNKLNILVMICPERFVRNVDNVKADTGLQLLYLPDFRRNKIVASLNWQRLLKEGGNMKQIAYYTSYTSQTSVGKVYPFVDSLGRLASKDFSYINPIQTQDYLEEKFGYRGVLEKNINSKISIIVGIEADITRLSNHREMLVNDTNFIFRRQQIRDTSQLFQVITPDMVNAKRNDIEENASSFINLFFYPNKRISGQIGLRLDYNGFTKQWVTAPRLNLTYHLDNNQSLSLGSGLFFQDPVLSELADLPINSKLLMEQVFQIVLAYRVYFKGDIKLMAEAWYKSFDRMVTNPVAGTIFRNNNGTGDGFGADLSLSKRLNKNWHGIISYSFMQVYRNDHDGLGPYPFTFSQPHQANLLLSYQLNKAISFSGRYRLATGRPKDNFILHQNRLSSVYSVWSMELQGRNEARLPFFSSLDLRLNYLFRWKGAKLTAFVDVVNVLNRQIANNENFSHVFGRPFYDGLAIFPSGGLKFEF